ncbi:hypothetical protein M514_06836 [Trichuris suis]|uniref:Uncharacterized protein n=1 Tax=Trichuris suis TaxID=68888 RepID=A0A085NB90_9BILA|nr:hypothetical protein M513_06836 [Trichuris suis]KFD66736.1 hypothetical protein M514_06836 [Trichuris suis]
MQQQQRGCGITALPVMEEAEDGYMNSKESVAAMDRERENKFYLVGLNFRRDSSPAWTTNKVTKTVDESKTGNARHHGTP